MTPEARLSPDGHMVALRFAGEKYWCAYGKGCFEKFLTDGDVADWTPLTPVRHVERATCPYCGRPDRALTADGRIRWHHGNDPEARYEACVGTGRRPAVDRAPSTGRPA